MIRNRTANKKLNIRLIIKREIIHKKAGFITGVLSLTIATAGLVGALVLLRGDELNTEQLFIEKEKYLREEMVQLEDDYRIIMRNMGYNVLIINENQNISELERNGYATTYLNYEDALKIANSGIVTLNHLLPVLQEKIFWKEKNREIILAGIQGQVPVLSKPSHLTDNNDYRSPIMERVPDGKADLGEEIATSLNLIPGDNITIKGEKFVVNRIYPQRGTRDDLTVWIPLDRAQSILRLPGKINGILALECVCAIDKLGQVKEDVESVLPYAKVFEFSSLISARADVRKRASVLHEKLLKAEITHQMEQRKEKEKLASILIILLASGASIWIFVLILSNVRERKHEIGILRAVGFSRFKVLQIFLGKSVMMGVVAGIIGSLAGALGGVIWVGLKLPYSGQTSLINPPLIIAGLLLAPVLALTAGFLPSVIAANQDPADILGER